MVCETLDETEPFFLGPKANLKKKKLVVDK